MTGGPNTPLTSAIEKSGYPFALAVERELRMLAEKHGWPVVLREVPVGDAFADLVLQQPGLLLVLECKRVEEEMWHFLVPKGTSTNTARCRVEWRNPRAAQPPSILSVSLNPPSKIFCSECTMAEGSYESSVAVLPRGKAAHSLEQLSGGLLDMTHRLGDQFGLQYDDEVPTYLIPVIVTNAGLSVCEYDVGTLPIETGRLGEVEFTSVDFLRFRKTLVRRASNDYQGDRKLFLRQWTADRERTVFVVSPRGLDQFLAGFRAFGPWGEHKYPFEFEHPPKW
jgi:hypothetical protein